eukprot:TRINITY_DN737_c7_g1_i1.p1 TRINITY_DN737_c7_g1~~TRINITY_DN737_c7_g1_i1.p1  ORF type:complete len:217 (-),score=74.57 TRINITY_DN737_c7_g1_i1:69-719(-)
MILKNFYIIHNGIPYRRGYLFHGPPGTGKTSFIQALASEFEYNICVLNLSERGLTDDRLNYLLTIAPRRSFILLEDIDAVMPTRPKPGQPIPDSYQLMSVTFSGLLNALDGVASSEERILFMTTNHVERLDPALIRPGRVDLKVKIDLATPYQLSEMFVKFFPDIDDQFKNEVNENIFELCKKKRISTAEMQGFLLYFKNEPKQALENLNSIFENE